MFTGIIESIGIIKNTEKVEENLCITVETELASELKIDESVSHNGVCLTIESSTKNSYKVTAIAETLAKTNLNGLKIGSLVNLERAMKLGDRLDGHIVQGHVDQTAICIEATEDNGSWLYSFSYEPHPLNILVEKGSITLNGISLTIFNVEENSFTVAIIPYTYNHTNMKLLKKGDIVNIEFDIIGKYAAKLMKGYLKA